MKKGIMVVIATVVLLLIGFGSVFIGLSALNPQSGRLFKLKEDGVYINKKANPASFAVANLRDAKLSNKRNQVAYVSESNQLFIYDLVRKKDVVSTDLDLKGLFVQSWSPDDNYILLAQKELQVPDTNLYIYKISKGKIEFIKDLPTYTNKIFWLENSLFFYRANLECKEVCERTYTVNRLAIASLIEKELGILEKVTEGQRYPQLASSKMKVEKSKLIVNYETEQLGEKNIKLFKEFNL